MDHAALVRGGDAGAELARDVDRLVRRQAPDAAQQRRQVLAVDVFHGEKAAAVGVAQVVEAADVLVRHLAREAQLGVELGEARGVGGDAGGQELEGDRLLEREVFGAVDLAHAAAAEQRHQPVARRHDCPRRKRSRSRRSRLAGRHADRGVQIRHGARFYPFAVISVER